MERFPLLYPIWTLDSRPIGDCLEQIAEVGFDGVSFIGGPTDDPRRVDSVSEQVAAALKNGLLRLALSRTLHVFSDLCFAGIAVRTESAVERARQGIESCVRALSGQGLPPLIVSLDPICLPPGPVGVVNPALIVEMLEFLVSLKKRYDIRPALENWPKPEVGTPEALKGILEHVGGEVGILLDTGHLNMAIHSEWCREKSPVEFIDHLPAPVLEVHLHDNHGTEDEHLPPGAGTADLAAVLKALKRRGFEGPVTLEVNLLAEGRPGLKSGLETARQLCAGLHD